MQMSVATCVSFQAGAAMGLVCVIPYQNHAHVSSYTCVYQKTQKAQIIVPEYRIPLEECSCVCH